MNGESMQGCYPPFRWGGWSCYLQRVVYSIEKNDYSLDLNIEMVMFGS